MTRLTKAGNPRMGETFEVELVDGTWQKVKLVGHGMGRYNGSPVQMVLAIIEYPESDRESLLWPETPWRCA